MLELHTRYTHTHKKNFGSKAQQRRQRQTFSENSLFSLFLELSPVFSPTTTFSSHVEGRYIIYITQCDGPMSLVLLFYVIFVRPIKAHFSVFFVQPNNRE
ncbi:unnamed protein product [Arabidopsis halleri]